MVLGDEAVATAAQRRVEALLHLEILAPAALGLPEPVDDLKRCGQATFQRLGADVASRTGHLIRQQAGGLPIGGIQFACASNWRRRG